MAAKTIFFGFDGADCAYMDSMMEQGDLPAFRRLKEASRVFNFENAPAMGAANFWNAASIGKGPGHHGHYFYLQFKPDTYDVLPNHESSLPDIKPFWNVLDDEGFVVGVVDWHRLQPKPLKNGMLIDNWMGHDPLTGSVFYPESVAREALRYFNGDVAAGGFACRKRRTADELNAYLQTLLKRIEIKSSFCADKLGQQDWDLFIACFAEAHDIGHYYYHLDNPNHERYDPALAREVREPLRTCYRALDKAVGEIIASAGLDAHVFVFGGPGMEMLVSANEALEEMLRRIDLGVGAPRSGSESVRQTYRSLIPLGIRRRLSPLARAVRRRVANHDYARRRFFAVPNNDNAGSIRMNVKGREKHGVIEPGAPYDEIVQEISDALATFKNPDTGQPLVKRVVRTDREFRGPHQDVLPDLFVEWNRSDAPHNFRKASSEIYGEIGVADVVRTGDHNLSGFCWTPPSYAGAAITLPEHVTEPVMQVVRTDAARPSPDPARPTQPACSV